MSRLLSEKRFDSGETLYLNDQIIRNLGKAKFSQGTKANGDDYSSTLRLSVCYNPLYTFMGLGVSNYLCVLR